MKYVAAWLMGRVSLSLSLSHACTIGPTAALFLIVGFITKNHNLIVVAAFNKSCNSVYGLYVGLQQLCVKPINRVLS